MLATAKVMDALKNIGLNLYERKLWVALLARGTATGGELSEISNVPRSRTYDIMLSLAEKGFVVVQTGKPIKYVAMAPEEALEKVKMKIEEGTKETTQRIEELKESAIMRELNDIFNKGLKFVEPGDMTGALKGKFSLHQRMGTMFKDAGKKISIVTTPEGMNDLHQNHFDTLKSAKDKGVDIKIVTSDTDKCGDAIKALSSFADIRHVDSKEVPIEGRFAIVDGKELVFGLSHPKATHATQEMSIWSKSEHAASDVLEPLFKLVWNHSKSVG